MRSRHPQVIAGLRFRRLVGTPDDRALVAGLLAACSPADLQQRFGSPYGGEHLARWLVPQRPGDVSLVALLDDRPVASTTAALVEPCRWEVSLLVPSPFQRRGIGTATLVELLRHLPAGARLTGQLAWSNEAAQHVLRAVLPAAVVTPVHDTLLFSSRLGSSGRR